MDLVLGLSLTSSTVRWVLVEGKTGEGATVDRGALDFDAAVHPDDLLEVLLADVVEPIHAVGVTWTDEAQHPASGVLEALSAPGYGNAVAISEREAAEALAAGLAEIADYGDVAVCIVEPDAAVIAMVDAAGVTVDRIARPLDGADVVELPSSVITMLELNEWQPEAIFVVGSADDLELVRSTLDGVTASPVFSAADADLALARGAALAAARTVNTLDTPAPRVPFRVGALASILVAAVVTFVVSASAALGLTLTGGGGEEQPQAAATVGEPAADEETRPPAAAVDKPTTPAEAMPVVAQTIAAVAPPPAAASVAESYQPPAYVPPAPAYVPPTPEPAYSPPPPAYSPPAPAYSPLPAPAPAYVAPAPAPAYSPPAPNYVSPVAPQPRLRDRIIERIPIINRFHEPDYPYSPR